MSGLNYAAIVKLHDQVSAPAKQAALSVRGMASSIRQSQAQLAAGFDKSIDRLKTLTGLAAKAGMAVGTVGMGAMSHATNVVAKFEDMQATLETLDGSSEKAKKSLEWIKKFTFTTPYELDQTTEAFTRLKAYGIDPMDGTLKTLGDTSAAMGKDLMASVDMMADAVVGENQRLKEFGIRGSIIEGKQGKQSGPKGLSMLGGASSKAGTADQIEYSYIDKTGKQRSVRVNKNDQEAIRKTLIEIFNDKFVGAMEKRSKTFNGILSNVKDTITGLQSQFMEAGAFDQLKASLQSRLDMLNRLQQSGKVTEWGKQFAHYMEKASKGIDKLKNNIRPAINYVRDLAGGWKKLGVYASAGAAIWTASPLLSALVSQLSLSRLAVAGGVLAWRNWDKLMPQLSQRFPALGGALGRLGQHLERFKGLAGSAFRQLIDWALRSGSKFGKAFGPFLTNLIQRLDGWLARLNQRIASGNLGEWLDQLWQKAQPAVTAIMDFGTGIWEAVSAVIDTVVWVKELVGGWENLGKVFVGLGLVSYFSSLLGGLAAIFTIISTPVGAIVVAVAAAAGAIYYLYKNWETVKASLAESWWGRIIINLVESVQAKIELWKRGMAIMQVAWEKLKKSWRDDTWGKVLRKTFDVVMHPVQSFHDLIDWVKSKWDKTKATLEETKWGKLLLDTFDVVMHPVQSFHDLIDWVKSKWDETKATLEETKWGKVLLFTVDKLFSPFENLKTIWESAKLLWEKLTDAFADIHWSDTLTGAIDRIRKSIDDLITGWEKVKNITGEAWDSTKETASNAWESTKGYAQSAATTVSNVWQNLTGGSRTEDTAGVNDDLMKVYERANQIAQQQGYSIVIKDGMRTIEEQRENLKKGASKTLNSRHLTGHALDLAVNYDGKQSNEKDWEWVRRINEAMQQAAKELNVPIEWGGNWKSFKDGFHWQLPWHEYRKNTGAKLANPLPFTAATKISASARMRLAINTLKSFGWSENQAIGLAANIKQESEFDPERVGDGGMAYGLGQWHADRQADFAKTFGKNIKDATFMEQLRFVQYELTKGKEQGAGNKLRQAQSAQEAAAIVSRYYERPLRVQAEMQLRAGIATDIENALRNDNVLRGNNVKPIQTAASAVKSFTQEVRGQHELTVNLKAAPGVEYSVAEKKTTGVASKFNLGKQAGAAA